jgi:hypothetical protein
MTTEKELLLLQEPIAFQWRVQSFAKDFKSAKVLAYIDARDCMKVADRILGPENWQSDFKAIGDKIYGGVGIKMKNGEWVWKWDCGSESNVEGEKGQASDAFKRAWVKWGLGRFLYDMKIVKLSAQGTTKADAMVINKQGQKIWDITKYVNEVYLPAAGVDVPKEEESPKVEKKAAATKTSEKAVEKPKAEAPKLADKSEKKEPENKELALLTAKVKDTQKLLEDRTIYTEKEATAIINAVNKASDGGDTKKMHEILDKTRSMYAERVKAKTTV